MSPKVKDKDPGLNDVLEAIESRIIFGALEPGDELTEDGLIDITGAKRHVVRAALEQMIRSGLITKQRGHSARVRQYSAIEVSELYHMRAVLHLEAVRIMPLPAVAADVLHLKEILTDYEAAVARGAAALTIHRLNDRFHRAIWALSRNGLLEEMIDALNVRSAAIRSHGITNADWLAQARLEHRAMIDAIERGDREGLSRLVVDHMHPTRRIWEDMHGMKGGDQQR